MADAKVESAADSSSTAALLQNTNATSQPNNPLSRKLNKILETRLDNDKVTVNLNATWLLVDC